MSVIKNDSGAATWLFLTFSVVIVGNIAFFLNTHKLNSEIIETIEEKQKINFFRSYMENILYNQDTCNELFLADLVQSLPSEPPFGTNLIGFRKANLNLDGSNLISENQLFDSKNNITILKMALIFDEDPKLDLTERYFYSANFRVHLNVDGKEYIESFPLTLKVAYEVEMSVKVSDYIPQNEIVDELLLKCRTHPQFPSPTHHDDTFSIEDLSCDMNFPQKFCMGNCLFKRTDNENRILACAR
ncbi:hypothetical protein N9N67_01065 [Bacteriovoracaceae bacterium]|nr:hypothetical protein [Bacteriovoracaceae bacterium]